MKFAIPMAGGKLTLHFGHCQEFAILEIKDDQIVGKQVLVPPPHEPGVLPAWLHELGTNVVIAGGMGHRAIDLFNQAGIKVVTGAEVAEPETLVRQYLSNALVTGANACSDDHTCTGDHQHHHQKTF